MRANILIWLPSGYDYVHLTTPHGLEKRGVRCGEMTGRGGVKEGFHSSFAAGRGLCVGYHHIHLERACLQQLRVGVYHAQFITDLVHLAYRR